MAGVLLLGPLVAPSAALASAGTTATTTGTAGTGATTADTASPAPVGDRVVLIGTGGVTWDDVSELGTPALWSLAQDGSIGNLVVRSVRSTTCPADGWLALSAGNRAADEFNAKSIPCRLLENADTGTAPAVPAWDDYLTQVADQSFSAVPGAFGDAVAHAGIPATAIGPGAAIALSTTDGTVAGDYLATAQGTTPIPPTANLADSMTTALESSRLIVVDSGSARRLGYATELKVPPEPVDPEATDTPTEEEGEEVEPGIEEELEPTSDMIHAQDVTTIDNNVATILASLRADDPALAHTTVILASVSDPATTSRLNIAAMLGDGTPVGTLTSRSTRQPGFVQTTDVLPTLARLLDLTDDLPRSALVGSPFTSDASGASAAARVDALVDAERHALATAPLIERFFLLYCVVNLLLFAAVSLGFSRRFVDAIARSSATPPVRAPARPGALHGLADRLAPVLSRAPVVVLTALRAAGIAIAAIPVATLLANLAPWWRASTPSLALTAIILAWIAAITAVAVLPPWRTWLFGPVVIVATLTAVVLAVDVATGAHLQVSALMGIQSTVAGRFYGFNNTAFALFATTTLLLAAAVSNWLVSRGRRGLAAVAVLAIGAVAVLLDGAPGIGADFGGPPALVPAFAILALLAAGLKVTWQRVVGVLGAGAVVVIGFAVLDWLRPPAERTHLGAFVDTVLDGGLWDVLVRKVESNIATFSNPLALVGVAGLLVILFVLARPLRAASKAPDSEPYSWLTEGAPLKQITTDAPMFTPGVISVGIALGIGTLVNDSGVVILAVGMSVLVPLIAATYAGWMLTLRAKSRTQVRPHP
ncbi:hypothetical protein SAMN05216410_0579 [Sanguibacter gelidistatuariae]|uniref:Uncharacterized protein n=2 Tax=Sanguibacter gelidistatuariae TaxID=1814289 RepID=A0A1G6GYF6_9MICO|nr:hypothetical protein SAMN05216410_0579 [Sanguibacter gelidistatuariae]